MAAAESGKDYYDSVEWTPTIAMTQVEGRANSSGDLFDNADFSKTVLIVTGGQVTNFVMSLAGTMRDAELLTNMARTLVQDGAGERKPEYAGVNVVATASNVNSRIWGMMIAKVLGGAIKTVQIASGSRKQATVGRILGTMPATPDVLVAVADVPDRFTIQFILNTLEQYYGVDVIVRDVVSILNRSDWVTAESVTKNTSAVIQAIKTVTPQVFTVSAIPEQYQTFTRISWQEWRASLGF